PDRGGRQEAPRHDELGRPPHHGNRLRTPTDGLTRPVQVTGRAREQRARPLSYRINRGVAYQRTVPGWGHGEYGHARPGGTGMGRPPTIGRVTEERSEAFPITTPPGERAGRGSETADAPAH